LLKTNQMTNKQVVEKLRSELKPYVGIMSPSYFSQIIAKIENDMCKPKTVDKIFNKFSYFGEWNSYSYTNHEELANTI
jgi:hypothetical protein